MRGFATPANAETHYMHLLQLNGLVTPNPANSGLITLELASTIFHLAESARDVRLYLNIKGVKVARDPYKQAIIDKANEKFPDQYTTELLTTLLNALINPRGAYPQQVEKAFLLAIRTLTHSIHACRSIMRPLIQPRKVDSPAYTQLRW